MTARKAPAPDNRPEFYKRLFRPLEADDLEAATSRGLQDEVWLLRVLIRRVVELAYPAEGEPSLDCAILTLDKLGIAAIRLAKLLQTQQALGKGQDDFAATLNQALDDVIADLQRRQP